MGKKKIKVAFKTNGYNRIRNGKKEHVSKYTKKIDIPELSQETKCKIKRDKALRIVPNAITVDGKRIIKNLDVIKNSDFEEYYKDRGIGACGSISKALYDFGYGKLVSGTYRRKEKGKITQEYAHYWIETPNGDIIDLLNDYLTKAQEEYLDSYYVNDIDACWNKEDINFWKIKISSRI